MTKRLLPLFLSLLVIATLALSACTGATSAGTSTTDAASTPETVTSATSVEVQPSTIRLDASYENAASVELQLILGSLKLSGTDQAFTKEQATVLLPLWQQLQTLSQSAMPSAGQSSTDTTGTDTQSQIDALVEQIQANMTDAQLQAIATMQITQETTATIMQELGLSMSNPGTTDSSGSQPPAAPGNGTTDNSGGQPPAMPGNGTTDNSGGQPPAAPGNGTTDNSGGQPPAMPGNGTTDTSGGQASDMSASGNMIFPELFNALIQSLANTAGVEVSSASTTSSTGSQPGGAAPGGSGSSSSSSGLSTATGTYTLDGSSDTQTGQTYTATGEDQSAIYVINGANLTLTNATVNKTGDTSSDENSSFYGLNAGILVTSGSSATVSGGSVTTDGSGTNGIFSTGEGTSVSVSDMTIYAVGDGAHAVMATQGGTMTLDNVDMTTTSSHSGAIATDRGSGTITATNVTVLTTGADSPAVYSTGVITVSNSTLEATGAEGAVIEGANSITLNDCDLTSSVTGKWGIMIYQSMSGDAEGTEGVFTMTGGTLNYTDASTPLFYVTNTNGYINLKGVEINSASAILVNAEGGDRWGTSGSNGGTVYLTADAQTLTGNLVADEISSITLTLKNGSTLTGAIDADNTAKSISLTLDASSTWTVTADSYLTSFSDADGISGTTITNIVGNGHTVYYDSASCPELGGKTYTLVGGGTLTPAK